MNIHFPNGWKSKNKVVLQKGTITCAWVEIDKETFLTVTTDPDMSDPLCVSIVETDTDKIAKHINDNMVGWKVLENQLGIINEGLDGIISPPQKDLETYDVAVGRTRRKSKRITVIARNMSDAESRALDEASNTDFADGSDDGEPEYEILDVRLVSK